MPTTRANLYVDQGIDYFINLELVSDDGEDFIATGYTFFCEVRKLYSSSLAFTAECTPVQGIPYSIDLFIDPEKTRNLEPGKYQYDVFMKGTGGSLDKILEGLLFIVPSITRVE